MKSPNRLIKFITALGFALTIAGLCMLIFPLVIKYSSLEEAKNFTAFLIIASLPILPLGVSLFVGGIVTLAIRKRNESKKA